MVADTKTDRPWQLASFERVDPDRESFVKWLEDNHPEEAALIHKLHHCAKVIEFDEDGKVSRMIACQCHTLCHPCAMRRQGRLVRPYVEKFSRAMSSNPNLTSLHVTLTTRTGSDLKRLILHAKKSLDRLMLQRRFTSRQVHVVRAAICAIVPSFSFEKFQRRQRDVFHVRVHCIWLCDRPISESLSGEWLRATGDSHVVHVERFWGMDDPKRKLEDDFVSVLGFLSEFRHMPHHLRWEAYQMLRENRVRMLRSYGEFRGGTVKVKRERKVTVQRFVRDGDGKYMDDPVDELDALRVIAAAALVRRASKKPRRMPK